MGFVMRFHSFLVMVLGVQSVGVREMSVVGGLLMVAILVVLGSMMMMLGGMLMMLSGFGMVVVRLVGSHVYLLCFCQ